MSVRRCILSWLFSVLACLSLSSLVAAQSRPGEHIAVLIGNELYPALNHNVDVTPNNLAAFEEYLSDAERLRRSAIVTLNDLQTIPLRRAFDPVRGDIARHLEQNPRARKLTVYYSGHGTQDPTLTGDDKGILLGTNAEVGFEADYGVRTAEIIDNLATLAMETDVEITLILEACFNGQTGSGEPINAEISGSLSDELGRKQAAGVTVISASSKTQPAYWQTAEESGEPLSRFTDAFLDALYGYGGGLDDGALTMAEALEMTNSIMQRSSNEQVATVAGFNPEARVLREGRFVDRLATQFVCDDEARTLKKLSGSCAIADIEAQLDRQQCRYPSQTPGYGDALRAAEDRYYTINRSTRLAQRLDQNWERSERTMEAGEVYLQQCTELAEETGCSTPCAFFDQVSISSEDLLTEALAINTVEGFKQYLDTCEPLCTDEQRVQVMGELAWTLHYDTGEYEEAFDWAQKAAKTNDAKGQFIIGRSYNFGKGVTQSYTDAAKWYRLAADQGNAPAQNNLGDLYYTGNGFTHSYTDAVKWYRLAADQWNATAQTNLGHLYEEGLGVTQSHTEAVKWYRLAADQGNAWAQSALGVLCEDHPTTRGC